MSFSVVFIPTDFGKPKIFRLSIFVSGFTKQCKVYILTRRWQIVIYLEFEIEKDNFMLTNRRHAQQPIPLPKGNFTRCIIF